MGADDAAPFEWFAWVHRTLDFNDEEGAYGMFEIDSAQQPGEADALVFFWGGDNEGWRESFLDNETSGSTTSRCIAFNPVTGVYTGIGSMAPEHLPNNMGPDANGADQSFPILFGRSIQATSGGFKGITDFIQWNGVARAPGETFNSLTRVSLGDVNVPWDGATVPLSS